MTKVNDTNKSLLKVNNLSVSFDISEGSFDAVKAVNFDLKKGETLAIIGESGSGKSVTASVIMGILTCPPGRIKSGEVLLNGLDILKLSDTEKRKLMGSKIAIIFQDTLSHLNPVFSVGSQIAECFEVHKNLSKKESWKSAPRRGPGGSKMGWWPGGLCGAFRRHVGPQSLAVIITLCFLCCWCCCS